MSHADVCRHHTLLFIMCGSILSPNHNLSSPEGRKQVYFYLCSPAAPSRVAYGGKWHIRKIIITSIDACLQRTNCCPKYLTGISSFDPDNKPTEVGEGLARGAETQVEVAVAATAEWKILCARRGRAGGGRTWASEQHLD